MTTPVNAETQVSTCVDWKSLSSDDMKKMSDTAIEITVRVGEKLAKAGCRTFMKTNVEPALQLLYRAVEVLYGIEKSDQPSSNSIDESLEDCSNKGIEKAGQCAEKSLKGCAHQSIDSSVSIKDYCFLDK